MFGGNKNLKDAEGKSITSYGSGSQNMSVILSYTKTDKLITALYMVTDIIDKDEPLRNKLRTLGTGIISDMNTNPINASNKILDIMSFLDIASAISIISEMNCSILKKEFSQLDQSIKEYVVSEKKQINLSEFFESSSSPFQGRTEEGFLNSPHPSPLLSKERGREISKGHTRIGVQKGSTLMKALSAVGHVKSINVLGLASHNDRREDIINIIKIIGGNATIKDIKDKAKAIPEKAKSLVSCGEKTLQRELVSMVKDGVLKKEGEKRWSRYFLK
jgi:hypothetical protein